jgi:streptogramin lyase/uncharacterized protein YkwD
MKQLFRTWAFLPIIACSAVGLGLLAFPGAVQAACPLVLAPAQNVENPNAAFNTGANVIASFNYARRQEGCDVPLSINQAVYDAASPQQQILLLINAERQDRGLGPLKLDATLLSQIALNHAREVFQYNYFFQNSHSSPINAPNMNTWDRIDFNTAIKSHKSLCCAENISPNNTLLVPGGDSAAMSAYSLMYNDANSAWGHRQNILGYAPRATPTGPGRYNWIGIGIATGGGQLGTLRVLDFFEDSPSNPYTPPSQADTQPPSMSPPTIIGANTVQVTNVKDTPDGSASGVAGVTGVVFYVGSIGYQNGTFTTVSATNLGNGTWQANLPVADVSTLHAVAVDGSGNYTDCAGNAPSCGAAPAQPKITEFTVPTADSRPRSITAGPDGNLWFTEFAANTIARITPSGVITEFADNSRPYGISSGPDGNIWFTENGGNKIGRITPSGAITEFVVPTADSNPYGITSGPDGNVWFTEAGASKIGRITPSGDIREFSIPNANTYPYGIASGSDGNLYFTEGGASKIGRITPSGAISEIAISRNSQPFGITRGPDGNIWFTERWLNKIGRMSSAQAITEFDIPSPKTFPSGICGGPDGNVWFSEEGNKIGRITPSGTITEFTAGSTGGDSPLSLTSGPDGNIWFVEFSADKIGRLTPP